jgi:hypothetical protein
MTNDQGMTKSQFRSPKSSANGRRIALGVRHSVFFRLSSFVIRLPGRSFGAKAGHFLPSLVICSLYSTRLLAATDTNIDNIPPLRPPRAELPPSFWEEHGTSVLLCGIALLGFIFMAVWWLSRGRPQAVTPPEVQAREALELLRNRPEDGALLSRVSQILRRYVVQGFELPPNEVTTTEFCNLMAGAQKVGPQFAASISEFLRLCDQRKFEPSPAPQPFAGVEQALKLIEAGEARRAQLRRAEQTTEAVKQ